MDQKERRRRERGALGLSVLLHGLVAPLFIAMIIGVDDLRPEGHTAVSGIFSISILHRAAPAPVRPAPAERTIARVAAPVVSPSHAQHPKIVAAAKPTISGVRNKTRHVAVLAPPPTPIPTPTRLATAAAARPSAVVATPAAAASPAPVATSGAVAVAPTEAPPPPPTPGSVALVDAPAGGWGQNFRDPMVLDDDALAALRSRYHGAVAHVDVDEEGHATHVSVEGPGLDADAIAALERRLFGLRYVPAECNGLRCAASLELRV